jgi:DNA-binding Lrp family transcriptional regulator
MIDHIELLRLIENNAQLKAEDIAIMLGADVTAAEVEEEIKKLTDANIILGYTTQINWEKELPDHCIGMIEVRIAPIKNKGYDHIAGILSKYDKVTACYLMSGGFDLMIIYEDKNLRNIANFVTEKIATQEGVLSTTTHFILKKYKANGIIFDNQINDDRQAIIL